MTMSARTCSYASTLVGIFNLKVYKQGPRKQDKDGSFCRVKARSAFGGVGVEFITEYVKNIETGTLEFSQEVKTKVKLQF